MNFWIEKTIVIGRPDRASEERALGKALWSPQKDKRGADIYKNMRLVKKGDIILHFINNSNISGVSKVKNDAIEANGIKGTSWDRPAYLIKLENYKELNPSINRTDLLIEKNKTTLLNIAKNSEVFYNNKLDLRQGAYLTPCTKDLLQLINETYFKISNQNLPYTENILLEKPIIDFNKTMSINKFKFELSNIGLLFSQKLISRFIASLLTKPFVILTGLSGSGKTKLAQAFAMWICENEKQYCIVPVGADWTNREPLLGFPNALQSGEYVKPDNKVLDLIIAANAEPEKPYFLILDEMNLSHVERYFADFLSVMESKSTISLHPTSDLEKWNDVPSELSLPKNLFIIGTVNIDETTYMFSPKVLDRANVIEFRVTYDEMKDYFGSAKGLELNNLVGKGANMAESFVQIAKDNTLKTKEENVLQLALLSFFTELKKTGAEFGYRSASEIMRFAAVVNTIEPEWTTTEIIDVAIMQKLLPKVHGSRRKLEPVLRTLGSLCLKDGIEVEEYIQNKDKMNLSDVEKVLYPISLEKVLRMYQGLIDNGFTSYAEA